MKNLSWKFYAFGAAVGISLVGGGCGHSTKKSGAGYGASAREEFKLPAFQEEALDNGLKLLIVPNDQLPVVSMTVFWAVGSVQDPSTQMGLNALTLRLLDKGLKGENAKAIAEDFARMGAQVSLQATSEYSTLSASTLERFGPRLVTKVARLLKEPVFPEAEVVRQRELSVAELRRLRDQSAAYANYEAEKFVFEGHPYAQPATGSLETLQKLRREDLVRHWKQWLGAQNATVALVGKISPELLQLVRRELGGWARAEVSAPQDVTAWLLVSPARKKLKKPGLTQAEIRVGLQGVARNHPDYLALRVANASFGEGMGGRLMNRLRVEKGLTYGVSSQWDVRRRSGRFMLEFATRTEKVEEALAEVDALLMDYATRGLTQEELDRAKAQVVGRFPWLVETPEMLATQLLLLRNYGVADDYLREFPRAVSALTLADVNAAIRRHVTPDKKRVFVLE